MFQCEFHVDVVRSERVDGSEGARLKVSSVLGEWRLVGSDCRSRSQFSFSLANFQTPLHFMADFGEKMMMLFFCFCCGF